MNFTLQAAEIKARASGQWPDILTNLGGIDRRVLDGKHHPCPHCGGTDRFSLVDESAGAVLCRKCFAKKNGDGLAALKWLTGKSFPEVVQSVADYLGMTVNRNNEHQTNGHAVRDAVEVVAAQKDVPAEAFRAFGATSKGQRAVFPYYGPDGEKCTTFSLTLTGGKGLFAKGKPAGLFFPHDDTGAVQLPKPGELWHLVEGVKDSVALHSLGLLAIGLNTCRLSAKFARLLRGVNVVLIPDRDKAGDDGAVHTASVLHGVASLICRAVLPAGWTDKDGADVRDVLRKSGGRELVAQAIADAQSVELSNADDSDPHDEAADDPHRLARVVMQESTFRFWRGGFYQWNGQTYIPRERDETRAILTKTVKQDFDRINRVHLRDWKPMDEHSNPPKPQKVSKGLIANVCQSLESLVITEFKADWPRWADGQEGEFVAVLNGILDVGKATGGGADCLHPHSCDWLSTNCLPYSFNSSATCPKWLAFLSQNLEGDPQRIDLLQEWFGLQRVPDTSYQKFMLMVGEGSNGKSVCCAVSVALLGLDNVSHLPLEDFGGRFQLSAMLGKLSNISSEIGELDKVAEGHLKSFTSGDRMTFENKHRPLFEAMPTARLTLATNNLPRFSDRSSGLWRRLLLMPWQVEIPAGERIAGMDSGEYWQDELPGILNWALAGLKRLRLQERFTTSTVYDDALAEYRTSNNPARLFLVEHYRAHVAGQVSCRDVYRAYSEWCVQNGYRPLADATFGKEVSRVFRDSKRKRIRIEGTRTYAYQGICEGEDDDHFDRAVPGVPGNPCFFYTRRVFFFMVDRKEVENGRDAGDSIRQATARQRPGSSGKSFAGWLPVGR